VSAVQLQMRAASSRATKKEKGHSRFSGHR
jgi:hypothetical protein